MSKQCNGCTGAKIIPYSQDSSCVSPVPRFDSVFIADVNIKRIGKYEYKINFSNISTLILYQVYSEINESLNDKRVIAESNIQTWVELFVQNQPFKPTIIMAQPPEKWAFVLQNVKYNDNKMTWKVTTKPIVNTSTTVYKKLITGELKQMRFDVGAITYVKNPCPPVYNNPLFNQIIIGNVIIKKLKENEFKIIFKKSGKITFYQVWSVNNDKRQIYTTNAFAWTNYLILNTDFKPTTVMEIENCRYAFVIKSVKYLGKNKMSWIVSTKEIANLSTIVSNNLKPGIFDNVRFDVDSISTSGNFCSASPFTITNSIVNYTNGSSTTGTITIRAFNWYFINYIYNTNDQTNNPNNDLGYSLTFYGCSFEFNNQTIAQVSGETSLVGYLNSFGNFVINENLSAGIKNIYLPTNTVLQLPSTPTNTSESCFYITFNISTYSNPKINFSTHGGTFTGILCKNSENNYTISNLITSNYDPLQNSNIYIADDFSPPAPIIFFFETSSYPVTFQNNQFTFTCNTTIFGSYFLNTIIDFTVPSSQPIYDCI